MFDVGLASTYLESRGEILFRNSGMAILKLGMLRDNKEIDGHLGMKFERVLNFLRNFRARVI